MEYIIDESDVIFDQWLEERARAIDYYSKNDMWENMPKTTDLYIPIIDRMIELGWLPENVSYSACIPLGAIGVSMTKLKDKDEKLKEYVEEIEYYQGFWRKRRLAAYGIQSVALFNKDKDKHRLAKELEQTATRYLNSFYTRRWVWKDYGRKTVGGEGEIFTVERSF